MKMKLRRLKMKMKRNLKLMQSELAQMVDLSKTGKPKTEKETIKSLIVNWKMICTKYLITESDPYAINVIYAFQGAVNTHLHELDLKNAYKFVDNVLETMKEVL